MANSETTPRREGAPTGRAFSVLKVYIKDLSFESPQAPGCFQQEWKPEHQLQIGNTGVRVDASTYEVTVSVRLTTQVNGNTVYMVELQQAGLFGVSGYGDEELHVILSRTCPNLLLPFAREALSDAVAKGGFPQYLFNVVNVDQLIGPSQGKPEAPAEEPSAEG